MSSLFKPKRSSADAKSSSKSSKTTEPDSKTQKNASSAPSSKSGAVHSPPPVSAGGEAASNSKPNSQPRDQTTSPDMQKWLDTECPIDSRTMQSNTLSISRSGRFKAKGKMRPRLFSEDQDAGSHDSHPNQAARGSSSLSTPEDRQTVLEAMAKRTGATTSSRSPTATLSPAGGNPSNPESGASKKSSDRETSAKWSMTTQCMDL